MNMYRISLSFQLHAVSRENKHLRRQLEEERSMRLRPPTNACQQCSSLHLPFSFSGHPPPPSKSIPSSLHLPQPLNMDRAIGDTGLSLTQSQAPQSWARETRWVPGFGRCLKLGQLLLSVSEDEHGSDQMKPPDDFDLSWLFDPQLLTRESAQYGVNVLQVKVKSQGAFCLRQPSESANDNISLKRIWVKISLLIWRHLYQ